MFPRVGSQIINEPGSPEDFHVMEVKNVSRDWMNVTCLRGIASAKEEAFLEKGFAFSGRDLDGAEGGSSGGGFCPEGWRAGRAPGFRCQNPRS